MDSETRFRAVFDVGYAALCRYARHPGLTGPDAEDLVAQTLEIAWRRIDDVPAAAWPPGSAWARACNGARRRDASRVTVSIRWRCRDDDSPRR